ncbi:MAG: STAS domain-containing protein [Candidatus Melainabacteria bacterium]|nr:STAS domain-containing protein [Candidatus Melainabacteria bacterium]
MQVIQEKEHTRLLAEEDFLVTNANRLQLELIEALEAIDNPKVILDLTEITRMDSIGIKLVLGLLKSCEQKNFLLEVEVSSSSILKLFHLCKLGQLLNIREVVVNE